MSESSEIWLFSFLKFVLQKKGTYKKILIFYSLERDWYVFKAVSRYLINLKQEQRERNLQNVEFLRLKCLKGSKMRKLKKIENLEKLARAKLEKLENLKKSNVWKDWKIFSKKV